MSEIWHRFEYDGKRYTFYYDELYQVERSCGGTTECVTEHHKGGPGPEDTVEKEIADCEKFFLDEIEKLGSGEWVVLVMDVERKCGGHDSNNDYHCEACPGWVDDPDELSCGGIVIENSEAKVEELVKSGGI